MRKSTLERYWEEEEFKGFFHDLLAESGLERINEYVQHGSTTVSYTHLTLPTNSLV